MATEYIGLPGELLERVKEAAAGRDYPGRARAGRSGEPPEPWGVAQDCRIWAPQRTRARS